MQGWGDDDGRPARTEVRRYLARIAARLQMPPSTTDAILDELASHLHDAIEAHRLDGMSREDAEREALARLGSPEALGDELRRTHQTTRRLLAAVGGGVFQGIRGGIRGWFGGYLASIPLFFAIALIAEVLAPQAARVLLGQSFSPIVLCSLWGAAWLSGRYLVEHISTASLRSVERLRTPVATVGAVAITIALAVVPMDQTIVSMGMTLVLPLVFAAGALTTDRGLGGQILDLIRLDGFPVRRLLFVGFATVALGGSLVTLLVAAVVGPPPVPPAEGTGYRDLPAVERWATAGYTVVSPTILAPDAHLSRGFERDGTLVVRVPTDIVDWDELSSVRFEAWEATELFSAEQQRIAATAPYEILPVADPWATHDHVVRVGQPGISFFLVFLTAVDPETGERVAIGWPDGDSTTFHGTVLDWFAQ